jgi:hypothetical protein
MTHPLKGKKQTTEHIEKRASALRGRRGHPSSDKQKEAARKANTGKVMSVETRKKIGEKNKILLKGNVPWNKGKKTGCTPWNKGKKVPHMSGSNHPNWRGGTQSESRKQRARFSKTTQQLVFQRDNYTCQICDQYSGYLHVDHIKFWADYPELRFELDNCRTLCMACHYYVTFKRKMPKGIRWGLNFSGVGGDKIR